MNAIKHDVKTTILIVEDSNMQAKMLIDILNKEGFDTFWVDNGNKALNFLRQNTPTIIISDVVMPEMDGFELCSKIKKIDSLKHIPFIILTSLSNSNDIINGLSSGADNFITKPYKKQYLISRINYLLANRSLRELNEQTISEMGIEILFQGRKHYITSDKMQIVDLLISSYEAAVQKNIELEKTNKRLREVLKNLHTLQGLIPICANCKRIRTDKGYWQQVETYISNHSDTDFTHTICPDCAKKLYPEIHKKLHKKYKD